VKNPRQDGFGEKLLELYDNSDDEAVRQQAIELARSLPESDPVKEVFGEVCRLHEEYDEWDDIEYWDPEIMLQLHRINGELKAARELLCSL